MPAERDALVAPWTRRAPAVALIATFFFSGSAGLMYEVVWTHQFSTILGSTSESMTLVFAAFLALLALGGYVCGRSRRLAVDPLFSYAMLECGIGVAGAGAALILLKHDLVLIELLPRPGSPVLRIAISLLAVVVLIGPATFLMGGTLPLMSEGAKRWYLPSRQITILYGLNTAGAAVGALLPGLLLIPRMGLSGTALTAMFLNFAVALSVILLKRLGRRATPQTEPASAPSEHDTAPDTPAVDSTPLPLTIPAFGCLAFGSGFSVLLLELCWGRLAKFVIGNRTLAISVLLCSVLIALGGSSLAHRAFTRVASRALRLSPIQYLVLVLVGASLTQLVCSAAGVQIAATFSLPYALRIALFLAVMLPAFFVAGLVFPWLLAHFPLVDRRTGPSVGFLYATNVVGSTLGAILTTFTLIEAVGTSLAMLVGSATLLLLAVGIVLVGNNPAGTRAFAAITVGVWLLCAAVGYPRDLTPVPPDQQLIASSDDRYGIQLLIRSDSGVITALNNNVRLVAPLGEPNTMYAQHLQADLPMLLAAETREIFNLGTGFGITAGAFTLWGEQYQNLLSVEILPFMVEHQPLFRPGNYSFYKQPRARFIRDDGRHVLVASDRTYDVLSINPIDPRLPGASSLSTVDFWRVARSRLRPGGVYAQLVWGPQTKMLVQAFSEVFPKFLMFRAYTASYVLIGFNDATPSLPQFHFERLTPAVRAAYGRFGIHDLESYFGVLRRLAEADTERWRERVRSEPEPRLHSDDYPILEYSLKHAPAFRVPDEEW